MKKIKKIAAAAASLAVMAATTMSLSGSAVTAVRDANGDGTLTLMDAVYTQQYLMGYYNPTSVKSFDYDGNSIISDMDIRKIMNCYSGNFSYAGLPKGVGADSQAVATTVTYMRHDCSSSSRTSYTEYSLTVNPLDNTVAPSSNSSQRMIIGDNDMLRDYDTAIVHLSVGTGFIVSDHVIATAAHCVYSYDSKNFYNNTIELTDSNNNKKTISAKYIDICKNYSTCNDSKYTSDHTKYDYALIYVDEDLSEYGALKLGVALDEYTNGNGEVFVSGFPSEYPNNYKNEPHGLRFTAKGKILNSDKTNLYYDADTSSGDSGGPVYIEEGFTTNSKDHYDYRTVIAINVAHHNVFMHNIGVRITPDILKFYYGNSNINY